MPKTSKHLHIGARNREGMQRAAPLRKVLWKSSTKFKNLEKGNGAARGAESGRERKAPELRES